MNEFDQKLNNYIKAHGIQAEQLLFAQSCHSVAEAAASAGVQPEDLVKNICLIGPDGELVVAIVKGEDRVDRGRVSREAGMLSLRLADPDEMLQKTGFPCGGTPSFGYPAIVLVDERVFEKDIVYTGGGSETSLMRVSPNEIIRASGGRSARIRRISA